MKAKTMVVFAVIALTVFAGAATAMPGSAPDNAAGDENAPDDAGSQAPAEAGSQAPADAGSQAANASEDADDARADDENASQGGPAERAENAAGPAVDLPAQVPDHVSSIHDAIADFLNGDGEGSLGETISGIVSDDAVDEESDDESDEESTDESDDVTTDEPAETTTTATPAA